MVCALSRTKKVTAYLDGIAREVEPGAVVELRPGESFTLFPGTFHAFWGQNGDVVVGEVSTVNDDAADNFFAESLARFTKIDEDEDLYKPLTTNPLPDASMTPRRARFRRPAQARRALSSS